MRIIYAVMAMVGIFAACYGEQYAVRVDSNNVVTGVLVVKSSETLVGHPDFSSFIFIDTATLPGIGWTWDGVKFSGPPPRCSKVTGC